MRTRTILSALAIGLAPIAAMAQPPVEQSSSNARASDGAKDQEIDTATKEKVICRRDKEIGSRVRARKVCRTAAQWAEKASAERTMLEQRQAQRTYTDSTGGL